ncbi:MAG: quercetin 2,3-dioxygenase [Nitrosopumilales archaeon CG15_BIG_FIL_POST_REV_8_21_14_020_37_12]|nr:MAG: quercetin 2,3-dioxygenase [Nitrosopumilales archaeon CG15_BIG_FIL_POST_REV_8_21_14_020_37_12]
MHANITVINIITNQENFKTDIEWLTSYHHFSFGEHFHPDKVNFGHMRVFNDDIIQPGKGFGFHQHHDMEIVTYVVDGTLEHKDNFGNCGIIEPGEVQRMSAGTGIFHSEYNHSTTKPLKLLQVWIRPNQKGLEPSWEQQKFLPEERLNKMLCVVSPKPNDSLLIHQDVSFYVCRLDDSEVRHDFEKNRMGYLFVISGSVQINGMQLHAKDSAKIQDEQSIVVKSSSPSEMMLIDLSADSLHL